VGLTVTADRPEVPIPALLENSRVVAIMRRTDSSAAVETARALVAGGVRCLEVTFDSPGVLEMIGAINAELSDQVLLGAGTVLDRQAAEAALAAGARFLVSPHCDIDLVRPLAERGVVWLPGAMTPTEILAGWRAGAAAVKVFPAGGLGPAYLKDVLAPLRGIRLMPTGGVNAENAGAFMRAGAFGLGVGSALVDPKLVAERRFAELTDRAARLTQAVDDARGGS
jgi:2-dehydro-3-deoxyphosphogluconate aldolase/(4S)-4-hydroxy-2-oxoglutarate aldolase